MTKRARAGADPAPLWRWQRLIPREAEALWTERMTFAGGQNWMIVERPLRQRLILEAYFQAAASARRLCAQFGGRVERFAPMPPRPSAPTQVSALLQIAHDNEMPVGDRCLIIPFGTAFGSGEHATTLMLLRNLARRTDWSSATVLDLGTGSGVLALAARKLGARNVVAIDFDPAAICTARQNERLNFSRRLISWKVDDVKQLRSRRAYSLIVANLYSEILIEAAVRIAQAMAQRAELWLSGVLRSQQTEVTSAFKAAGLHLQETTARGKWVMQRWTSA